MQEFKFKKHSLIFVLLLIESICLFLFAPDYYHYGFNLFCMCQYLFSCFLFLKLKKKQNYFDFDVIFMFSFFFVMFFYPVFMFQSDPLKYFAFQYEFNENVISRSTALSLLGMQSYFLGSISFREKKISQPRTKPYDYITSLTLISAISFFLFIVSGGYASLKGAYSGEEVQSSGLGSYFRAFTTPFLYCALALQFDYLYKLNKDKFEIKGLKNILIVYTIFFSVLMVMTGSRANILQVILICGGLYTAYYKNISFVKFIPLMIIGILGMFAINIARGGGEISGLADIVMDLIINNRNTYMAVDYVDVNGITYGKTMFSVILAPFPFMQKIIFSIFHIDVWDASSSALITKISLGGESELGLGTNIIADLYMSFGMIGVIVLMFFLGRYISKFLYMAKNNIYALIAYSVMMSYSVYIVRSEFFFAGRDLLWGIFFFFCIHIYNNNKIQKKLSNR
ncbi:O-antigen polymerase [Flavobacterium sharifuzzamanii]|uniref:O-antigen polymerase n=1 Tax=Flavobacterium sharifuzzamanii TaxID=2211133 RepID=UPI000DAD9BC6|nr:O-antigen polymerase [Flavobacterium sharifuzzamanii]KAF2081155.1 oligosaccharide repeat unit polymerase [Flavobacterium sharifuzzamanii]